MAPRTRSNRQEKLAVQKLLSSGISVNTHGFPALPNELYLEILSYLPFISIPYDAVEKMDPYRQLTLYYLSQTCRSLRKFFLRYAWERIEVFGGMWSPTGKLATKAERKKRGVDMKNLCDKKLVQETLRQLQTATVRNPDLRQYVSIVNLTILEYSYDSVLPEIAHKLSLFPNLHSVQLISRFVPHEQHQFFSKFRYPNVRTLHLIRMKYGDIFHACPNARYVSRNGFHIRDILDKECASSIEKLGHASGLHRYLNDVVRLLPRLCDFSLGLRNLRTSGEGLKCLSSLPLHTIRLRLYFHINKVRRVVATPSERQQWINLAKEILAKSPLRGMGKKVIVVNRDAAVEIYTVT